MSENKPLACDLTAIENHERDLHKENAEAVFKSVQEWQEVSDGYAFRIPAKTEMIEKAGAFMARERKCCPFFNFNLEITAHNGVVWLKLSGSNEVKNYVRQNVIPQLDIADN